MADEVVVEKADESPLLVDVKTGEEVKPGDVTLPGDEKKEDEEKEKPAEKGGETEEEKEEDLDEEDKKTRPGDAIVKQIEAEVGGKELLKKVPDLRGAIYRGYAYTRLFGDMESAKSALEDAEAYREFQTQIMDGDPGGVLTSLSQADKGTYTEFCKNILPTLYANDKDTFAEVVAPIVNNIIATVHAEGVSSGNKNLINAALYFAKYYRGKFEAPQHIELKPSKDPGSQKLKEERDKFSRERFETVRDDVAVELDSALTDMVGAQLGDYELTPYIKRVMVKDVIEELTQELKEDSEFQGALSRIWTEAKATNFSPKVKPRIRSAYLGRVRAIVAPVLRRHLKEAGVEKKASKPAEKGTDERASFPSGGGGGGGESGPVDARKIDWNKTSTEDVLLGGKAVLKKG